MKTTIITLCLAMTVLFVGATASATAKAAKNPVTSAFVTGKTVSTAPAIDSEKSPNADVLGGLRYSTKNAASNHPLAANRAMGGWTWWGYRTNSWETWAIATYSPSYIRGLGRFSFLASWSYALGWTWHFTAQNARMMGKCLGIDWAGTGLIVGCSSY